MFTLNGRRHAGQMSEQDIMKMAADCYREYKDPRGNRKLPLSRQEVREMFQDLFFEDLDMHKGICDRIFESAFHDLDRDGDSMVTVKELQDYFINIAKKEGSLRMGADLEDDDS